MRKKLLVALCAAGLAGLVGCGGGGGGTDGSASTGTATLSGRVAADTAARVAAKQVESPVDVVAVDETGAKAAEALGVTDMFELVVPTGHEYVLIFSDAGGIIGAMVYGEPMQSEFSVDEGTIAIDLGEIVVNPSKRFVHAKGDGLKRPDSPRGKDSDDDGIPDRLDDDDDNDGIPDGDDVCEVGDDCSLGPHDHDNDGVDDDMDDDDDDDGIKDGDDVCGLGDDCSHDKDNDGEDDDRYQCDKRFSRGAQLWAENGCGDCHGADGSGMAGIESIRGVNVNDIVHALKKGEDDDGEFMPKYPELVRFGVDFRSFLGCGDDDDDDGVCADGDAANGQAVFDMFCIDCHAPDTLRGESAEEIAEVLAEGEDDDGESMPAFPELVDDAADIAAYVAGCPIDGGNGPGDADSDGVTDDKDQCPNTVAGAMVDADGCSADQLDPDGDGVVGTVDLCPGTATGATVDADGCSADQLDPDGDGVLGAADLCPGTATGATVDADGCSDAQKDSDGDGVSDADDQCANTPAGTVVGADGCSVQTTIDTQAIYSNRCAGCHESSAPNLSGVSVARMEGKFLNKDGSPKTHNGKTLVADEISAMVEFFAVP